MKLHLANRQALRLSQNPLRMRRITRKGKQTWFWMNFEEAEDLKRKILLFPSKSVGLINRTLTWEIFFLKRWKRRALLIFQYEWLFLSSFKSIDGNKKPHDFFPRRITFLLDILKFKGCVNVLVLRDDVLSLVYKRLCIISGNDLGRVKGYWKKMRTEASSHSKCLTNPGNWFGRRLPRRAEDRKTSGKCQTSMNDGWESESRFSSWW